MNKPAPETGTVNPGILYLFPTGISSTHHENYLPAHNLKVIQNIRYFFVENLRSARRFISSLNLKIEINSLHFFLLDKDTGQESLEGMLRILLEGHDAAILSEAGCPGVADPGSDIVLAAHGQNIKIIPLIGPSSIILALMASGFNGQNFAFNGYLPIDDRERMKRIRELEAKMINNHQTQIFMETPYRNEKLMAGLLKSLSPETLLCIASDITGKEESIRTMPVKEWNKNPVKPDKVPSMYLIYFTG